MKPVRIAHTYYPGFDVFRGIGILFVVLAHSRLKTTTFDSLRPIGALGVHMFFALSGFLITRRLVEESEQSGAVHLGRFYRRRARRILPPALIYLGVVALVGPLLHYLPTTWAEVAACLSFTRNLYQPALPAAWYTAHFWSLSLEEQFYLFWPPLVTALGPSSRLLRVVVAVLIALTNLWRSVATPVENIYRSDLLADHLLWGCLIALQWHRIQAVMSLRARTSVGLLGILVALILLYHGPGNYQGLFAAAVAIGFIGAADGVGIWAQRQKLMGLLGRASYDVYLWQSLFLPLPYAADTVWFVQRVPFAYLATLCFSALSFRLTFPKSRRERDGTIH